MPSFVHFLTYVFGLLDYVSELNQLHPIFLQMSHSEAELCQMLEAMAKCVETSATAHKNLLEPSFIDEKDYISYIEAVKESLVRRDAIQNEFDVASEELNKRTFERDQVCTIVKKISLKIYGLKILIAADRWLT